MTVKFFKVLQIQINTHRSSKLDLFCPALMADIMFLLSLSFFFRFALDEMDIELVEYYA